MNRISAIPPRRAARVAGFLYLLIFIAAPSGAKTATPLKLTVTLACDVGVALLLYYLLRPVNTRLALFATLFRLVYVVVMTVNSLNYFGFLALVANSRSPSSFDLIYGLSLVPFGLSCILVGYLVHESKFLPRWLGVLMAIAGAGYLTFVWPSLARRLFFPWLAIAGVLGEGSLTIWLLAVGVDTDRWDEQASQHGFQERKGHQLAIASERAEKRQ